MSHYDRRRVVTYLPDVPVERERVGAMALSGYVDTFRPYVYRGNNLDIMDFYLHGVRRPKPWRREPEAPPAPPKPAASPYPDDLVRAFLETEHERQRQADLAAERARLSRELEERHAKAVARAERKAESAKRKRKQAKAHRKKAKAETPKPRPRVPPSNPRPAPGWTPPTGGDLEAWLDQLD